MMNRASFYSELAASESRTAARDAQRENGARSAMSYHQVQTEGIGQVIPAAALEFDVVFLTEPVFSSGSSVITQPSPARYSVPVATVQLTRWLRNERGFYLGAFVAFDIKAPEPLPDGTPAADPVQGAKEDAQEVRILHHLSFNAFAYKPLGDEALADLESIVPRPAGGFW